MFTSSRASLFRDLTNSLSLGDDSKEEDGEEVEVDCDLFKSDDLEITTCCWCCHRDAIIVSRASL